MKRILRSPIFTIGLFVAAAVLILVGGMGTVRAAPRIQSNDWKGEVELTDISTSLVENGNVVASKNGEGDDVLLGKYFLDYKDNKIKSDGSNFALGKTYTEELAVQNDGTIDEYVRVTVTKYWVDEKGDKLTGLDPGKIDLNFVEGGGWTIDHGADTAERTVLYYKNPDPNKDYISPGDVTAPFTDTIRIDPSVMDDASYNGANFRIKAVVDAVQTHNADAARVGAWGLMK